MHEVTPLPTLAALPKKGFDWTVNLGHILIIVGLLVSTVTAAIGVYMGVFQTLTEVALELNIVKGKITDLDNVKAQALQNTVAIAELQRLVVNIEATNAKIVEQLIGLRVDLGVIKNDRLMPMMPPVSR